MNTKLLLQVKEQILKEPDQFTMADWFTSWNSIGSMEIPNCGTAACIGGWALAIHKQTTPQKARDYYYLYHSPARALDLPVLLADKLFYETQWPSEFQRRWEQCLTTRDKAQVAADRIDHFILHQE